MPAEEALAVRIVLYLRRAGWEVFKEVLCPRGKRIADIYARRKQGGVYETWAIEVKTSFGLSVMEQATYWQKYAHNVSVAVPPPKKRRARAFGYKVCAMLGLGVLHVSARSVRQHQTPRRHPNPKPPTLYGEQKHSAAGNSRGEYWTPLDETLKQLTLYVKAHPGCTLAEAVKIIPHHYKTTYGAHRTLARHLRHGKAKDTLRYRQTANGVFLNPRT